jgi:hypothetical protein
MKLTRHQPEPCVDEWCPGSAARPEGQNSLTHTSRAKPSLAACRGKNHPVSWRNGRSAKPAHGLKSSADIEPSIPDARMPRARTNARRDSERSGYFTPRRSLARDSPQQSRVRRKSSERAFERPFGIRGQTGWQGLQGQSFEVATVEDKKIKGGKRASYETQSRFPGCVLEAIEDLDAPVMKRLHPAKPQ